MHGTPQSDRYEGEGEPPDPPDPPDDNAVQLFVGLREAESFPPEFVQDATPLMGLFGIPVEPPAEASPALTDDVLVIVFREGPGFRVLGAFASPDILEGVADAVTHLVAQRPGRVDLRVESRELADALEARCRRSDLRIFVTDEIPELDLALPLAVESAVLADEAEEAAVGHASGSVLDAPPSVRDVWTLVESTLLRRAATRWENPDPAARKFFAGSPGPTGSDAWFRDPDRLAAFITWLTTFRRPQLASATVLEEVLDDPDLPLALRAALTSRARSVPCLLTNRGQASDGSYTVEDAFTGEVSMIDAMDPDDLPPVGRTLPAILYSIGRQVAVQPLGPVLDEATRERALTFLAEHGVRADAASRVRFAHQFGSLFAFLAESTTEGERPGSKRASERVGAGLEANAAENAGASAEETSDTRPQRRKRGKPSRARSHRRKGLLVREPMLDLTVTLKGTKPAVRRRFLIERDATFAHLHKAIQDAFGWEQCHLWEFRRSARGEVIAQYPPLDGAASGEGPDARTVPITRQLRKIGDTLLYCYDFGDDWQHTVRLSGGEPAGPRPHRHLISGAMACPPEDCGGMHGYERCKHLHLTGEDPWVRDGTSGLEDWLGDWHPDAFDLDATRRSFDS